MFADDFSEMKRQALEIASWEKPGNQLYVKIPIMNSKGESSIPLIRELSAKKVKLNVTAIYSLKQVSETCDAVKTTGSPTLVSVFAGRIADTGVDPLPMMKEAVSICNQAGPAVELLWASTREVFNIVQADQIGCKIITSPADLIKKIPAFGKSMEQLSLETVKTFKADAESAGFSL